MGLDENEKLPLENNEDNEKLPKQNENGLEGSEDSLEDNFEGGSPKPQESDDNLSDFVEEENGGGHSGISDFPREQADFDVISEPKIRLQTPIIISGVIVLISVVLYLSLSVFFDRAITGTWLFNIPGQENVASPDEANTPKFYFIFEPGERAKMCLGSSETIGSYTLSKEENDIIANIEISNGLTGRYVVNVYGNKFTGRQLELDGGSGNKYTFDSTQYQKMKLSPIKDFKIDKELIGEWRFEEYQTNITFKENGTMLINDSDILLTEAVYSVADTNVIKFKFFDTAERENTAEYSYDKNSGILTFAQGEFKRVEKNQDNVTKG